MLGADRKKSLKKWFSPCDVADSQQVLTKGQQVLTFLKVRYFFVQPSLRTFSGLKILSRPQEMIIWSSFIFWE